MRSLTEQLWFEVPGRRGFVNITGTVAELVRRSGVQEGLCLVNAMHITASVFINDAEEGLLQDYEIWLERLAPYAPTGQYRHNLTGEDKRRRAPQAPGHGSRGRRGDHQGQAGFRPVGADFRRRVRRQPPQARTGKNHRGVKFFLRR